MAEITLIYLFPALIYDYDNNNTLEIVGDVLELWYVVLTKPAVVDEKCEHVVKLFAGVLRIEFCELTKHRSPGCIYKIGFNLEGSNRNCNPTLKIAYVTSCVSVNKCAHRLWHLYLFYINHCTIVRTS
jgi:hypothetical protein